MQKGQNLEIIENDMAKIFWNEMVGCDHEIGYGKPDIMILNKEKKAHLIIDIAFSGDERNGKKRSGTDTKIGNGR
ncbi:Hypothetical predicted protein [Octopus vulgaris]|uniref:Uncharacterized protein n=1 Tax=Octopus vulgaris TaxID=6645 RepID=A0AA36C0U8_OCTVU|nr:Hypothetical predicted protein [Octopus vulgaris]